MRDFADAMVTAPPRSEAIPSLRRRPTVANHKRKRPKHRRAGCLLCKPSKLTANKKADRARARREWQRHERRAW